MMAHLPDLPATRFLYRAATREGRIRWGILVAPSGSDVTRALEDSELSLLSLRPIPQFFPRRPIGRDEVAIVLRNVATLVAAGVPIERALASSEPLVSDRLSVQIVEVRRQIREGRTVAHALEAFGMTFPRPVIGMIRAGESGSSLAAACAAAAEQLEESARLESRVRAALAYPALILVVGLATVSVMGTVVVPRFVDLLTDLGAEPPRSTRALIAVASALRRVGPVLLVSLAAGLPLLLRAVRRKEVQLRVHSTLLGLPLTGPIRLGFASARLCRALGGMLDRGMPLLMALDASADATGDLEVSRRLSLVRHAVARGSSFSAALEGEAAVDRPTVQLVAVGESSGRLAEMVSRAGEAAGERAERSLRTAVALLEPLLVLVLGVLIAAVAAALLQAVYSVRPI